MKKEQNFWLQFVNGDNTALGDLYTELFEPLVFISYYYVKNNEVARDIVSDLFVSLLSEGITERKLKWENVNSVQSYLTTAVKYKSIDYLRKNKKHSVLLESIERTLKVEEDPFYAENIKRLPKDEQRFYQLHLDGFKNEELAKHYQLSEKTIRNKLSLTRKKMVMYFKFLFILFAWYLN
jgi:RNA polymerase sigma factor (sigma-70 family)